MPEIGEIKKGSEIGHKGSGGYRQYIWQACVDCSKEHWVLLDKGFPQHQRCQGGYQRGLIDGRLKQIKELKHLVEEQANEIRLLQGQLTIKSQLRGVTHGN